MSKKPIILDRKRIKQTILDNLKEQGDVKDIIEAKLKDSLKANLFIHICTHPESRLAEIIAEMDLADLDKIKNLTLKDFAKKHIENKIGEDENLRKEYDAFRNALTDETRIMDLLKLDQPLDKNPLFADIVKDYRLHRLIKLTVLKDKPEKIQRFLTLSKKSIELHPGFWNSLEKEEIASKEEIKDVQLTFELAALTLDNLKLVKTLKKRKIESLKDLIPYHKDHWLELFRGKKITPPDSIEGENPEDIYATHLVEFIANRFPTAVFFARVISTNMSKTKADLSRVDGFLKANPKTRLEKSFSYRNVRWPTDDPKERNNIKKSVEKLRKLIKLYSHLGLEKVINDPNKNPDVKINELEKEIEKLKTFFKKNPNLDLQHADFHRNYCTTATGNKGKKINWKGYRKKDRKKLIKQLKVYQRLFRIYPRFETTKTLLEADFDSARKITLIPKERFAEQCVKELNYDKETATHLYNKALGITENTILQWANVKDAVASRHYNVTRFNNISKTISQYYESLSSRSLSSFQEMFGSLDFCECKHCRSIFSPAAYLVDLMRFIDNYITNPSIPSHLSLKSNDNKGRRPDLWEINLDCENTNTLIPYLELVIEILERHLGGKDNKEIPYKRLLESNHPFNMPFNLPLEQIRIYLRHFKKSLSEIYKTFDESNVNVAKEFLHISQEELSVLTTSTVDENKLRLLYGINDTVPFTSPEFGGLFKVKTFLHHTGLSRKELNELLFQNLDRIERSKDLQNKFFINNVPDGKNSLEIEMDDTDPDNRFEKLSRDKKPEKVLSEKKLDRIHRFVRLSKKSGWSFADLDWVLRSIDKTEPGRDIDNDAIIKIAKIKKWQEQFKLSLDVLCSFWYTLKNIGKVNSEGPDPQDLFDRAFNHPDILSGRNPYDVDNPVTWNIDDSADENRNRLLATLELYDEDLNRIVRKLTDANRLELNLDNLSRLYRFSKIPKVLELNIQELLLILELMGKQEITNIDEFDALVKIVDWIKTSDFSVYELHYILRGDLNEFIDVPYTIDDIALLTEDLSADLANLEKRTPSLSDNELGDEKRRIMLEKLGILFGKNPAFLRSIIDFAAEDLGDPNLLTQLFTKITIGDPIPNEIDSFLRAVHRRVFLVDKLKLQSSEVDSIKDNTEKEYYGITDPTNLTIEDIKRLHTFKQLTEAFNDNEDGLISYFKEPTGNDDSIKREAKSEALGHVTKWNKDLIKKLYDHFWNTPSPNQNPSYNNVDGLIKLKKCFDLSTYLGVGIEILLEWLRTANGDWDINTHTANSVLEMLKAKYDEETWEEIYKPFHDEVREIKRDALSTYAVWNIDRDWPVGEPRIKNLRDLYEYLLIDVEMSSCREISKIKEAILCLQLYIQRCKMNLEPGVTPESIPEKQWAWMKNYRIWEANRRVFLYPETYIEPELRDNKSPIFQELEDELLQSDITDETVEKAYKNYMDKFSELANLKIAGNYYDRSTKTLFLFGRTNTEPYTFYYRKYDQETTWTPWEKINLSIKSEYVSPIYVFNKLFIFWIEIAKTKVSGKVTGGTSDDPIEKKKLTIKYSYYTFNKTWTRPQILRFRYIYPDIHGKKEYDCLPDYASEVEDFRHPDHPFWKYVSPTIGKELIENESGNVIRIKYGAFRTPPLHYIDLYSNLTAIATWIRSASYIEDTLYTLSRGSDISGNPEDPHLYPVKIDNCRIDTDNYYSEASIPVNIRHESMYQVSDPILNGISENAIVKVVNKNVKPDRFIFDNGDEEFLIQLNWRASELGSIASAQPEGAFSSMLFLSPSAFGDFALLEEVGPFEYYLTPPHKFTRISTHSVHKLSQKLFIGGVDELLSIPSQQNTPELDFQRLDPDLDRVTPPYSEPQLDFEGAYGLYYREIFFHIPFLIANRLNANQKFKEAQRWYHYIFNPTISKPENGTPQEDLQWRYSLFRGLDLEKLQDILSNNEALDVYHNNPFKPHTIARLRLNAYQKAVVMEYIANLLDWGDYYFAQYTWESLIEATMLYVLAYELLGPRPEKLEVCESSNPLTFEEIKCMYETGAAIPEFLIDLENTPSAGNAGEGSEPNPNQDVLLYFCIPENADFIEYWDKVEERLYKIRHCMTIEGVVSQPTLFEPRISPMALVRAVAAGRDIGSVLADIARPLPHYRFTFMLEKAKSLTSVVQQFGSALLSALEKKDAEELSLLRSTHEKNILQLTTSVKEKQLEEAIESHAALLESKASAKTRNKHYKELIKKRLSKHEELHLASMLMAWSFQQEGSIYNTLASIAHLIPQIGSPFAITFGGREIGASLTAVAAYFGRQASFQNLIGSMSTTLGSYERRKQEWEFQRDLSQHDIDQIEKQIAAAELRKLIAGKDVDIHNKNIEQTDKVYGFLRDKFSSKDLYQWMANQLSGIFFQTYKIAYDLAKSAEKAFQYERNTGGIYINFGHWDSLKKGLLAGERLMLELNQLEKAYIDDSARTFEIEKTVSLAQLEPTALLALKDDGACEFELTEALFDYDFPGHYCRKIKTISVSIPAVVGPYENIKATLTQLSSNTMLKPDENSVKYLLGLTGNRPAEDILRGDWRLHQQIAISKGVDDSGMFELNFRDERYLPFEGTGAVSRWRLEMPKATNRIDFDSISDVAINLKYSALSGGDTFKEKVVDALKQKPFTGYRILSLRHEFSTAWHQFMNPSKGAPEHTLRFGISDRLLPPNVENYSIKKIYLKLGLSSVDLAPTSVLQLSLKQTSQHAIDFEFKKDMDIKEFSNGFVFGEWVITINREDIPSELRRKKGDSEEFEIINDKKHYYLDSEKLENMGMILVYEGEVWSD